MQIFKENNITKITAFCSCCQQQVELSTFENAANFCFTTPRAILMLAAKGKIHRLRNRQGFVMICQNSLQKIRKNSLKRKIILFPIGFINQSF